MRLVFINNAQAKNVFLFATVLAIAETLIVSHQCLSTFWTHCSLAAALNLRCNNNWGKSAVCLGCLKNEMKLAHKLCVRRFLVKKQVENIVQPTSWDV
jgi:hypothetical protein